MKRKFPLVLAALLFFALALLVPSPMPVTAQQSGGKCGGCYKRYDRCSKSGDPYLCKVDLIECLSSSGCPLP